MSGGQKSTNLHGPEVDGDVGRVGDQPAVRTEQRAREVQSFLNAGVNKVSYKLIFFPIPFFKILTYFLQISILSPLDILPNSFNILEKMILLPQSLLFVLSRSYDIPFPP